MTTPSSSPAPRILVVDDNPAIHADFRKILCGGSAAGATAELDAAEAALFGEPEQTTLKTTFRVDSAHQGQEALEMVRRAVAEGDPYQLAFVDVRMPPGWDGVETLERLWQVAPDLQAVICTAHSDYAWDDFVRRLGQTDSLLILKKPFETIEVLQLAHALTRKWELARQARLCIADLDRLVQQRTAELVAANAELQKEIAQRLKTEVALRESQARFSRAFEFSPVPLALLRVNPLRCLDANPAFVELSGWTRADLLAAEPFPLQWLSQDQSPATPIVLDLQKPLRQHNCRLRRPDGQERHVLLSTQPFVLDQETCLLVAAEDITTQIRLEEQLRQTQKLEAVGQLTAGIAHEFNNILTVIIGNVSLLQSGDVNPGLQNALLERTIEYAQRAARLTQQLLAFSRRQWLQPRPTDLAQTLQRLVPALAGQLGDRHAVRFQSPATLPPILADPNGIEQVLLQLLLNARDAAPDGDTIEITTGHVQLDETAAAKNPEARPGSFVWFEVTDHGCGISPDVLPRIFDPFFTTKGLGRATGLGLSTAHGIVKQHEGWIEVRTEPGRGSSFRVYLPVATTSINEPTVAPAATVAAPTTVSQTAPAPITPPQGQGPLILFVEDELPVRDLTAELLKRRGFRVLKARDADEAMQVWESCGAVPDILLTDVIMPGTMNGHDLALTLQCLNPDLKVIYTSGYSPDVVRDALEKQPNTLFLPKPYHPRALFDAIERCLRGETGPACQTRQDLAETTPQTRACA
ncbi:response regulator [Limisphaera ngatamarikiensis]|uniref:histidine kinase n=1 Tax=Limisphaera ngatamarikiensis TaxID=1324935 RepID=A0A6M1RIX9_9BACT|nr:response regulator [Limisphaera ngatamarikiensis]NGO39686.1 response regulator [Limisphaera ngatamarikiensis]